MRVMGIDQSLTCTGWCVTESSKGGGCKVIDFGSIHSSPRASESTDNGYDRRIKEICQSLLDVFIKYNPDSISMEGLAFMGSGNRSALAGLYHAIRIFLGDSVPIHKTAPTSLKKRSTGNGRASKTDMVCSIEEYDKSFYSDLMNITLASGRADIADAYWLSQIPMGLDNCTK